MTVIKSDHSLSGVDYIFACDNVHHVLKHLPGEQLDWGIKKKKRTKTLSYETYNMAQA